MAPPRDYANDPDFDLGLDEYGPDPKLSTAGKAISATALLAIAVGGFLIGKAVFDRLDAPPRRPLRLSPRIPRFRLR